MSEATTEDLAAHSMYRRDAGAEVGNGVGKRRVPCVAGDHRRRVVPIERVVKRT
jgi:hypothetical protein